jgi:cellulose synthase/poly-beta-1,6-N-acetylglucosamine synthase-like glycosyltransferase
MLATIALVVFWVSMAGLVYAYFGYPLLLLVLARRRRDDGPGVEPAAWPSVVLLIPVHNERANIEAKLANAAALEYPGRLRVCFISDGSTDGTNEYIEAHVDARTTFIALSGRNGKAGALNRALQEATEDIVVFTDASIMLAPDAIHRIVQPFTDPRVGCVSGEDRIEGAGGEGLYGRYELFVRRRESEIGSIVGASGSFYAQRRHLCEPFVPNLAPDFWSVLRVVEQGYRAISEPTAVGSMTHVSSMTDEFTRKVRTLLRGITTLWRYAHLMNPFAYGFFAIQLLSHKLARWLVPFFLAGALIASAVLAPASPWFAAALAGQVVLYLLALAAHAAVPPFAGWRLARIAYYFTAVNVATLVAWLKYVGGVRQEIWTPSQR